MSRTNVPTQHRARTHEGGRADPHLTPLVELERAVSTCLLWERAFYTKGSEIAARIAHLCGEVALEDIAVLAVKARTELKLRHVPLFLAVQMARLNSTREKQSRLVSQTITAVVQRPDELAEFLSLYWQGARHPLAKQVKLGLRAAFQKFSREGLAKWNRDGSVKLRDVLFMVHGRPRVGDDEPAPESVPAIVKPSYVRGTTMRHRTGQGAAWSALIDKTLESADTWEVALSAGVDKKGTWERLLTEQKLGYIALLMNLRNMAAVGVDPALVEQALLAGAPNSRALPFRFISAAKAAPMYADALSRAMTAAIVDRLEGDTAVLVDVSGSMDVPISAKSQLLRWEAGSALAVLLREMVRYCRVFSFSDHLKEVMNVRGVALVTAIGKSQRHHETHLAQALGALRQLVPTIQRIVVITDEQTSDGFAEAWAPYSYLLNVAPEQPGLETKGGWTRINGWSEQVVRWMAAQEGAAVALDEGDDDE